MRYFLLILITFFTFSSYTQFQFNFNDSLRVLKNGVELKLPWAGGLNYAQVSDLDVDFDGDLDLLVFDRSNDQIRVFEQRQEGILTYYKLSPQAHLFFPMDIRYRLTAVDYNNDGKKDLFTYGIGGVKVYKNVGNSIDGIQWELAKNLLYSDNWGTQLNLYVSSADIPAIVDVDNDGDIDILTYHISGEYLQYHKNLSQELYGHSDSLVYQLKNECWGGFREDVNSNTVFLNDQTSPCQAGNIPNAEFKPNNAEKAHSGSTVLALDYDGSGVKDLILGDVAYPSIDLLINGGTSVNTNSLMISADPNFPSNSTPVTMQLFPAAYWVDVDFDGNKDLLIAPNAKNVSENEASLMKYSNSTNNTNPNFIFETRAFLQEEMIEHGTGSIPVLVDIDNDGLEDLFVANFFSYKPSLSKESRIAYYKNTGTVTNPIFTFIDGDFLNLSQSNIGLRFVPTFGDLDNDGKKDMILGLENGSISYYKNTSSGSFLTFAAPIQNVSNNLGQVINIGQYATPQLFDLNRDGKLDLIIGKKTGELVYFENIGSLTSPVFELKNSLLGGVDVSTTVSPDGFATPHFFRYLDTTYLLVGSLSGASYFYKGIDNHLAIDSSFELISADFLGLMKNVGAYSACAISDIDNDNKLDLFIGQDLGGIFHLEHDSSSSIGIEEAYFNEPKIQIYPNPTNGKLVVELLNLEPNFQIEIYSTLGSRLAEFKMNAISNVIDISSLPAGIYIVYIPNIGQSIKINKQ
jgi:hypothetical protein